MVFLNHKPNGYKVVVDHIDNNKENNSLDNIQLVSSRENSSKDRLNETGYTGVTYSHREKNPFRSMIYLNGKIKSLGNYKTAIEASKAYQIALSKITNIETYKRV